MSRGVGLPCLFRPGAWDEDRDLIFLVGQLHRLLTVDPDSRATPGDALNPEAARYWAGRTEHALPLEPPLVPPAPAGAPARPRLHLRRLGEPTR